MKRQLILSDEFGDSIDLYNDSGIRIVSTDGIGFNANITTTELYLHDGSMFQSSRLNQRGISLVVRYIGAKWKHEGNKLRLDRILNSKSELRLRYVTDNMDLYIDCRTEQVNTPPNTFPMVTQISFLCPDPYWRKYGDNSIVFAGVIPLWEFICEIPESGMEFGEIVAGQIKTIYNDGSVDCGAEFEFIIKIDCSTPKIENIITGEYIQVDCELIPGDILKICTEHGKKSVTLTRSGIKYNYINRTKYSRVFLQIHREKNILKYSFLHGDEYSADITCRVNVKYGGI